MDAKRGIRGNIFILLGKFHIHKTKWTKKKKTRFQLFKIEFQHYMKTLEGLKNQKAIKTVQIYEALEIICKLSLN